MSAAYTRRPTHLRLLFGGLVSVCLAGWFSVSELQATVLVPPPIDMFVIIDESGSWTASNFTMQKDFVVDLANRFTFGTNAMNAGLATMGTTARQIINLTASRTTYINAAANVSQAGGSSNLLPSLTLVQGSIEGSTRPTAEPVIVFVSDGTFGDDSAQLLAKVNELGAAGYHLFPIGVGSSYDSDMPSYVRNGGEFFTVTLGGFGGFDAILDDLVIAIASVPEPGSGALFGAGALCVACRRWRR